MQKAQKLLNLSKEECEVLLNWYIFVELNKLTDVDKYLEISPIIKFIKRFYCVQNICGAINFEVERY